jgi:hypothetical protein
MDGDAVTANGLAIWTTQSEGLMCLLILGLAPKVRLSDTSVPTIYADAIPPVWNPGDFLLGTVAPFQRVSDFVSDIGNTDSDHPYQFRLCRIVIRLIIRTLVDRRRVFSHPVTR